MKLRATKDSWPFYILFNLWEQCIYLAGTLSLPTLILFE